MKRTPTLETNPETDSLIPMPDLRKRAGRISRITVWRLVRDGDLPPPIRIGTRNFWSEREFNDWIARRLAARS